jgi:HK97 family phage major capsid protein
MSSRVGDLRDDVKQAAETVNAELKNLGKVTDETKQKADEAMTKANAAAADLDCLKQTIARIEQGGSQRPERKSVGQEFIESEAWKEGVEQLKKRKMSVGVEVKQLITSLTTNADGSAGDAIAPDRRPGILQAPQRRMTIRALLTPGNTASNSIQYVQETGFTNNAATQAGEGAQKAESTIKLDLKTIPVVTIAHSMMASKQVLDDAPQLRSFIDGKLVYGYNLAEENEFLNGDGTTNHIDGLLHQATAYSPSFAPALPNRMDVIMLAMLQTFLAEWPATGVVLNPIDWCRMELEKDSLGRYIIGNPQGTVSPTLWGAPVVATQAMSEDSFLVGAFQPGAQIFDRESQNIQASTEDRDNFIKNLVTILCEGRTALAVYRPEAFVTGEFGEIS